MTSTSFNVGLGDGSRASSRVLRPPGGGHTDIFGGEAEPPRGRRPAPSAAGNLIQGQGDEPAKPTNGADTPTQNGQACEAPQPAPQPAPKPAPQPTEPAPPTSTPETRTPEARTPEIISPKAISPNDPPKRVRVPPGGFSSGLW